VAAPLEKTSKPGTVPGTIAALAKGMVGSGILSLSAGVAAFTRAPEGLVFALVMLAGMTALSAYTFQMVAEVSAHTGSKDFGGAWAATVGERTGWVPQVIIILLSMLSCVVYAMIMSDNLASILRGLISTGAPAGLQDALLPWCSRGPVLLCLSVFVLLPLCLKESFAGLALTSAVGLVACAYLSSFVVWRCFDGSYLPGGQFFNLAPVQPVPLTPATSLGDIVGPNSLVLLSTLGVAYMNHGSAPGTYQELAAGPVRAGATEEEVREAKLRRYLFITAMAFLVAGSIGATVMASGFLTFGPGSAGLLLANYANTDVAAAVARMCVIVSVLFGFPLNFVLMRIEAVGLVGRGELSRSTIRRMSVVVLAAITMMALSLKNLGRVQAIVGSTLGSFVVFTAPGLMARGLRRSRGIKSKRRAVTEVAVIVWGGILSSLGLAVSLSA